MSAAYITTRRFNEATVTIISNGTMVWTPHFPVPPEVARAAMPDVGPNGELTLGLNVALVQLGDAVVLIDPGCDDPGTAWDAHFAATFPPVVPSPALPLR